VRLLALHEQPPAFGSLPEDEPNLSELCKPCREQSLLLERFKTINLASSDFSLFCIQREAPRLSWGYMFCRQWLWSIAGQASFKLGSERARHSEST